MGRPRHRLGGELLTVALVVACLAATLASVVAIHRRPPGVPAPPVVVAAIAPTPQVVAAPKPVPMPAPIPVAAPPATDPTAPIVAELAAAEAKEKAEADRANRRAEAIEAAARAAKAGADRASRNLMLARRQIDALANLAADREVDAEMLGLERDSLARRRDALKAEIKDDAARPAGYAVLPHRGPNGTWRRPIVIECVEGGVLIRPEGGSFGLAEITSPFGRSNAFVAAVARESVRVQRKTSPDGGDVVPYIFFIVRPDGIRPYYEARSRLERLGVAFGYELADADWQIDVPDLDNPATWDGSRPPATATAVDALASLPDNPVGARAGLGRSDNPFIWPKTPPGIEEGDGSGPDRFRSGDAPRFLGGLTGEGNAADGRGRSPLGSPAEGGPGDDPAGGRGGATTRGRGVGSGPSWDVWDRTTRLDGPDRPVGLGSSPTGSEEGGASDGPVRPGFGETGKPLVRRSGQGRGSGGNPVGTDLSTPRNQPTGDANLPAPARGGTGGDTERSAPRPPGGEFGSPGTGSPSGPTLSRWQSGDMRGAGSGRDSVGSPPRTSPFERSGNGLAGEGAGASAEGHQSGTLAGSRGGSGITPGGGSGTSGETGNASGGSSRASGASGASGGTLGGSSDTSGGASGTSSGPASPGHPGGASGLGIPSFGQTTRRIELVLACGPRGVAIHPGDYRVTTDALKATDPLLVPQLKALVRHKENALKGATILPTIRYVIEPGGQANYATARGQLAVAGIDWPTTIQVSGGEILRLYSTDAW